MATSELLDFIGSEDYLYESPLAIDMTIPLTKEEYAWLFCEAEKAGVPLRRLVFERLFNFDLDKGSEEFRQFLKRHFTIEKID